MKRLLNSLPHKALNRFVPGVAATFLAVQSFAQVLDIQPFAYMTIDGGDQIPIPLEQTAKGWVIPRTSLGNENMGWGLNISGELNPDPSIAYMLAVADFGAPSVFGFSFGIPIVPTAAPNWVTGSIVGGLTDTDGRGISLTPTAGPLAQTSAVSPPMTSMGVDVGAAFVAGASAPGAFHTYGPFAAGPLAGPGPGPWSFLIVDAVFGLSGGGDIAELTGFASITPVPEVNGGFILGVGALLGGFVLRMRSRLR